MASCVLALRHTLPLQSLQSPTRAGSALCRESVGTVGLTEFGSASSAQQLGPEGNSKVNPGAGKAPSGLGFEGEALENGAAQPQQNTDETPAQPDRPKPFKLLQWKVYLPRYFHVVGLFPPLCSELGLSDG